MQIAPKSSWAILVVALTLSHLAVGFAAWIALSRVDSEYVGIVGPRTEVETSLQRLALEASQVHRFALNLLLVSDEEEQPEVVSELERSRLAVDATTLWMGASRLSRRH